MGTVPNEHIHCCSRHTREQIFDVQHHKSISFRTRINPRDAMVWFDRADCMLLYQLLFAIRRTSLKTGDGRLDDGCQEF